MARPGPMPFLGQAKSHPYKMMRLDEKVELKDAQTAQRAQRLVEFFNSEVWLKDILPLMRDQYDAYLEQVKNKTIDPDALKVLDDLLARLGGSIQIGVGAMERIAKRRLEAAERLEQLNLDSAF